jgi:hypothetical protein
MYFPIDPTPRANWRQAPFYNTAMTERDGPHDRRFHDVWPNTDPLGCATERRWAAGMPI